MSDPIDVARYVLINDEDELRCGWRVLAFVAFVIVLELLFAGIIKTFGILFPSISFIAEPPQTGGDTTPRILVAVFIDAGRDFAAALVATLLASRLLERRSLASVGFKFHPGWARDFALGSLLGGSSLAIAVGIATAAGAMTLSVRSQSVLQLVAGCAITFVFFLVAGATEELLFRGFPFQALAHNLGGAAALGITSVLFGLAHLGNENASLFSTLNTVLAGVWLGLAYLITRNLWLATALHYSWNFAMMFVFGLPVSGFTTFSQVSWLQGHPGFPDWISGSSYGPEAGAGATAALILSTLVIWRSGVFSVSEVMLVAMKHGKRESRISVVPDRDTPIYQGEIEDSETNQITEEAPITQNPPEDTRAGFEDS